MEIAFRVDASIEMGTGHLMRCLTLADVQKARGATTRFICRFILDGYIDMVLRAGHQLIQLPEDVGVTDNLDHSLWLGTSQGQDANDTRNAMADAKWDWLVVDHYALDARWESALRVSAARIMVIDDIADRLHDCDLLLDQNFHADMDGRYIDKISESSLRLLGPRYALLRQEFRQLRLMVQTRKSSVKRVLVFFGGIDAANWTGKAIRALLSLGDRGLHVDVVIGAQHPARSEIVAICAQNKFECHVQSLRMAELMAKADLALGAGGSASWERCCVGLPTLCIGFARNQEPIAQSLQDAGAVIYLGNASSVTERSMADKLLSIIEDTKQLESMSKAAFRLVDGEGTTRVCESMWAAV